jgi:hypothetical protein
MYIERPTGNVYRNFIYKETFEAKVINELKLNDFIYKR